MPIFRLPREAAVFPDPRHAEPDGLLAVGGDLSPPRLLAAYREGIFPWFNEESPILWWSPDPRLILVPEELHVPRSLERTLRRGTYRVTADTAFGAVIRWGWKVAANARSRFAQLAAAGLSATIFFYSAINLMMVMGLAPVVGIPLPMVSFGGSAVMTIMLCLGILMALERQQRTQSRLV